VASKTSKNPWTDPLGLGEGLDVVPAPSGGYAKLRGKDGKTVAWILQPRGVGAGSAEGPARTGKASEVFTWIDHIKAKPPVKLLRGLEVRERKSAGLRVKITDKQTAMGRALVASLVEQAS
jgi:hypothetical protein